MAESVARRLSAERQAALAPAAERARLEQWMALVRLVAVAFLSVQSVLLPPREPRLIWAAAAWLAVVSVLVLLTHARAPSLLASQPVRLAIFALDAGAAAVALVDYASPGDLTWFAFIFIVLSGAIRWDIWGAAAGFAAFVIADLPIDVLTPPYTHLKFDPASITFKLFFVGMMALFFGLQNRNLRALAADKEDQAALLEELAEFLGQSEAQLRVIIDNVAEGIVTVDSDGSIRSFNPAAERLFRFKPEDVVGSRLPILVADLDNRNLKRVLQDYLLPAPEGTGAREVTGRRSDGSIFPLELRPSVMSFAGKQLFIISFRDISERKAHTAALEYQALHDALTGLPNRTLMADRVRQALLVAQRDRAGLALLLMDMDRFKTINDTLGHHHGDLLLQQMGIRLREVLRESDTVARLGGDEFAMLVMGAGSAEGASTTALKILEALRKPITIEGQVLDVVASIGVAMYPDHGTDFETLMRRADVAMYTAKRTRSGYSVYSSEQDEHSRLQLELLGELRTALDREQLLLNYQPKIDLATGIPVGVEALLRWRHPVHGLLGPAQFIPEVEQTELIGPLTRWVLHRALRQLRTWLDDGLDLGLAVNFSAANIHDPALVQMTSQALVEYGVDPSRLTVEITETIAMQRQTDDVLQALAGLGVRLALDDFGTGYSSLTYLKRLPIAEIKIDKAFVIDMSANGDEAIVRPMIDLAHNLGLRVVAEGVEDEETLQLIRGFGADYAQGHHVSEPLAGGQLGDWVRARAEVPAGA